jgi:hypothetical protein
VLLCDCCEIVQIVNRGELDLYTQRFRHLRSRRCVKVAQHNEEFLAAHSSDGVALTHSRTQNSSHLLQHPVANRVTESIIEISEAVNVDHYKSEWLIVLMTGRPRSEQSCFTCSAIAYSSERVCHCLLLERTFQVEVRQRYAHLASDVFNLGNSISKLRRVGV